MLLLLRSAASNACLTHNNPYKYVDPDGEFLNFAAKFVLDVGINVAFNYVTTGQMDVGGALKESAVGIFNPAKTVAKAGKLALALSKVEKKLPPPCKMAVPAPCESTHDSVKLPKCDHLMVAACDTALMASSSVFWSRKNEFHD